MFDNADMIISRYGEEQLVTVFKKFCKQREDNDDMTQVVVTARTWHPTLKRMRERMREPLLLIGNFLEAALYGNMNIQVQCTFEAKKMDLVRGKYSHVNGFESMLTIEIIRRTHKIVAHHYRTIVDHMQREYRSQ